MGQRKYGKGNKAPGHSLPGRIMKVCLIISFLLHAGALLGFQLAFPAVWTPKPLRTFKVELFRPPIDPLDTEQANKDDLAEVGPKKKEQQKKAEDTISLDTKDKRYSSYAKIIKESLIRHWTYPQYARDNLIEGEVLVVFSLNRFGRLEDIEISLPSEFDVLNKEASRAIRTAAPFPTFPRSIKVERLNIRAKFTYKLTTSR